MYNRRRKNFMKTCVLCSNTQLKPQHKLCSRCYQEYKDQMHEPWFIELERMQRKQDEIDRQESFTLLTGITKAEGKIESTTVPVKKGVGRPPTRWILVNEVLSIYDESVSREEQGFGRRLSLRQISKRMNNRVKYLTVRRILKAYRASVFPDKVPIL